MYRPQREHLLAKVTLYANMDTSVSFSSTRNSVLNSLAIHVVESNWVAHHPTIKINDLSYDIRVGDTLLITADKLPSQLSSSTHCVSIESDEDCELQIIAETIWWPAFN